MTNTLRRAAWFGAGAVVTLCLACPFEPVDHSCSANPDCDDGLFCNGVETCDGFLCQAGTPPCDVASETCPSCDEDTHECIVPECTNAAECDDGEFCNGVETCIDECACAGGSPPCENDCDEEQDDCFTACVDNSDCDDGNLCTSDWCWNGACSKWTRHCSGDTADCNPATGLCELPDGSDPCLSYCEIGDGECVEPDIDQMDGFDTRVDLRRVSMEWCTEPWCFLVAGTCQDGTVFLYGIGQFVILAEYFESDTGAFVGRILRSDAIDSGCCGMTYWPRLIECEDAVVTEVFAGEAVEVGDSITLPKPRPGPCF